MIVSVNVGTPENGFSFSYFVFILALGFSLQQTAANPLQFPWEILQPVRTGLILEGHQFVWNSHWAYSSGISLVWSNSLR